MCFHEHLFLHILKTAANLNITYNYKCTYTTTYTIYPTEHFVLKYERINDGTRIIV